MSVLLRYAVLWMGLALAVVHAMGSPEPAPAGRPDLSRLLDVDFHPDPATEPKILREEVQRLQEVEALLETHLAAAIRELESTAPAAPSAAYLFYMGSFYLREGSLAKAEQAFLDALNLFPTFRRAWRSLAAVQLEQAEYRESLQSLGRALELGAGDVNVFGMIAYCHLQQGNLRAALTAYDRAILLEPDNAAWLQGALQCQLGLKHYRDAMSLLAQLEAMEGPSYALQVLKARICHPMGAPLEAMIALETAALYRSLEAEDQLFLADLYLEQGDAVSAVALYRPWSLRVPAETAVGAGLKRMQTLSAQEAWAATLEWVTLLQTLDPLSEKSVKLLELESARMHLAKGEFPAALESLESLLQADPAMGEAALLLAEHHASEGNAAEAERYFTRAFVSDTFQYRAAMGLAKLRLNQQRYAEALGDLEIAHQLQPGDPQLKHYIETLRAYVFPQSTQSIHDE